MRFITIVCFFILLNLSSIKGFCQGTANSDLKTQEPIALEKKGLRAWILIDQKNNDNHQKNHKNIEAIITYYHPTQELKYLKFFRCINLDNHLSIGSGTTCYYLHKNATSYISVQSLYKNAELKNGDTILWEGFFFTAGAALPVIQVTKVSQWISTIKNVSKLASRSASLIDGLATLSLQVIQGKGVEKIANDAGLTNRSDVHLERYQANIPIRKVKSYSYFTKELLSLIFGSATFTVKKSQSNNCKDCYDFIGHTPYLELRSLDVYGQLIPIFN